MKNLLKIESGKAKFLLEDNSYCSVSEISREDILRLLNEILDNDVSFDDPENNPILNEAEKLIFKDLFDQFNEVVTNKSAIIEEVNALFKEKLEQYDEYNSSN